MKRLASLSLVLLIAGCGGDGNPAAPTPAPTPTPTRTINVGGDTQFGAVTLGASADGAIRITNTGNTVVTVTSLSGPCTSMFSVSWSSGTIQPGATQAITLRFSPTAVANCNGSITVNSDATGGVTSIAITASGSLNGLPIFSQSGSGDAVFSLPPYVSRLQVVGNYSGSCQNFIVRANGSSFVNVIIGTCSVADTRSPFSGTYVVPAGAQISIVSSTGVNWTISEVR